MTTKRYWIWSVRSLWMDEWMKLPTYMDEDGRDSAGNSQYARFRELEKFKSNDYVEIDDNNLTEISNTYEVHVDGVKEKVGISNERWGFPM